MTDRLTTGTLRHTELTELTDLTERFEPAAPAPLAPRPVDAPHWTQHPAHEFPHRTGEHAPNLATLAQLRSGGRNPLLLSAKRRRQVSPKGCTQR
jgi:hypothetical protein